MDRIEKEQEPIGSREAPSPARTIDMANLSPRNRSHSSLRAQPLVATLALLSGVLIATLAGAAELRLALPAQRGTTEGPVVAVLTDANDVYLEAQPLKGEGLLAFCRRLCDGGGSAAALRAANGDPRRLLAGVWYRVPLDLLAPGQRKRVLNALFPADRAQAGRLAPRSGPL